MFASLALFRPRPRPSLSPLFPPQDGAFYLFIFLSLFSFTTTSLQNDIDKCRDLERQVRTVVGFLLACRAG